MRGIQVAHLIRILGFCSLMLLGLGVAPAQADGHVRTGGTVPGEVSGSTSDADFWGQIRHGLEGKVSISDQKAATMINTTGQAWRVMHNGVIPQWGGYAMLAMLVVLAAFFAYRGKIRVVGGMTGRTIQRFNLMERSVHWVTAISFLILGVTGLNVLYGRVILKPILGPDAFAALTYIGKWAHNWIAFAFMAGVIITAVIWIRENIPNKDDVTWLSKFGGLLNKDGSHVKARKFNAGQKIIYWSVVIFGGSISVTGVALLIPFELNLFGGTFAFLNMFGLDLPSTLTVLEETQLAQLWHSIVALGLTVLMFGHIYLGTIGMEGAFDAMYTGDVDEAWAKEHHELWVEEMGQQKQTNNSAAE